MPRASTPAPAPVDGELHPPSERGAWLLACTLGAVGLTVFLAVLTGLIGQTTSTSRAQSAPPVLVRAATPVPGRAASASALGAVSAGAGSSSAARQAGPGPGQRLANESSGQAIVAAPSSAQQGLNAMEFAAQTQTHISRRWMEGFYPIYAVAQETFGVNWLLIASIHKQETAFSTAPTTYHGLNFAGCCGGPMQFNVTNGPVSTWDLVSDSYIYGRRPPVYDHMTATHPSIYDDFDSIMAAAHLLSADGAEFALDGAAWDAAYDYYGHDATGVTYADQVLARAIGWSQHGFCINCGLEPAMVQAVHAAYGAPVLAALIAAEALKTKATATKTARSRRSRR
jgi:hypothetical protein